MPQSLLSAEAQLFGHSVHVGTKHYMAIGVGDNSCSTHVYTEHSSIRSMARYSSMVSCAQSSLCSAKPDLNRSVLDTACREK